jgi:hypothetical protein
MVWGCGLDLSGSGQGLVVGRCENGNKFWFHKRQGIS